MGNRLFFYVQLVIMSALLSCKAYQPVTSRPDRGFSESEYINTYKDIAVSEMKRTGIPASITLAQGMIESDFGKSSLAREANNHFGIKCHNDWTGPAVYHNDDRRNECFRKYRRPEESYYDHSDFLKSGSRYDFLFDIAQTDYKGWARGLKKAGYATNPDYANMLIRKIEENNLMIYDQRYVPSGQIRDTALPITQPQLSEDTGYSRKPVVVARVNDPVPARVPRVLETNRIQYIIVKDGDTREKLENEFKLLRWELSRYNELNADFQLIPGQVLFLQPKRDKAEPGKEFYTTLEGDTMYQISQKFGIKLKSIYEMNRLEEGSEPGAGKKLWLRTLKPVN